MKINRIIYFIFWLMVTSSILSSCKVTRTLQDDQILYKGHELNIISTSKSFKNYQVKNSLEEALAPDPNRKFLGLPLRLSIYNTIKKEPKKKKGLRKFIKNKIGEAPVLFDSTFPEKIDEILKGRVENLGYFDAEVTHQVIYKKKKAKVKYTVILNQAYFIDTIIFLVQDPSFDSIVFSEPLLIKKGQRFNLNQLDASRKQVSSNLREKGYYYFNPNYIMFRADTNQSKKKITIQALIKKEIPEKAKRVYYINNIKVFTNFNTQTESSDTLVSEDFQGINIIQPKSKIYKSEKLAPIIYVRPGEKYSFEKQQKTVQHLNSLDNFSYINIAFTDTVTDSLNLSIFLTPATKRNLQMKLTFSSKSNGFVGPIFGLTTRNRNPFKGAAQLQNTFNIGYEKQFQGNYNIDHIFSISLEPSLVFPRFIAPFNFNPKLGQNLPKTSISLTYNYLNYVPSFISHQAGASFGYDWNSPSGWTFSPKPLDLMFQIVNFKDEQFKEDLNLSPSAEKSLENQLILGGSYAFTYFSKINDPWKFFDITYKPLFEMSGNILAGLYALAGSPSSVTDPNKFLGVQYSQYVKIENDLRLYFDLRNKHNIAYRIMALTGIPYGNSLSMPYIKQYFVGGANSVRGFQPRVVGPGSYAVPSDQADNFIYHSGDIWLETNLEYRFPLSKKFRGALFTDLGNVWLYNEDPERPGGQFKFNTFYKDLAWGSGIGIRYDLSYFIVRLDYGIQLHNPSLSDTERWVIKKPRFKYTNFSFAIGYPF